MTERRGDPPGLGASSACTSTSTGLVPLQAGKTPRCRRYCRAAPPGTGPRDWALRQGQPPSSRTRRSRRWRRSGSSPRAGCGNWWPRSPSKYSTASTMCSSTRGPASAPSLVTWPTSTRAKLPALASRISSNEHARYLRDGAGRALDRVQPHGLDRVDDHQRGVLRLLQAGDDVAHR